MTKPYTKRRPFSPPSSAERPAPPSGGSDSLALEFLDRTAVFETMRAYHGHFFRAGEHLERLKESCIAMGRALPWPAADIEGWMRDALKESGWKDASLRLSLHWADEAGEMVAIFRPFQSFPAEWYANGVEMKTAVMRRWTLKAQDPRIKASQFVSGVLAHLDAGETLPHELLMLGSAGTVAEGTISNIFIVKRNFSATKRGGFSILTPSVSSGILKGVTRQVAMDSARGLGFAVKETFLTRHDLYVADECFMTNTSSEVLPVVRLDGRVIGDGKPGPATKAIAARFKDEISKGSR